MSSFPNFQLTAAASVFPRTNRKLLKSLKGAGQSKQPPPKQSPTINNVIFLPGSLISTEVRWLAWQLDGR